MTGPCVTGATGSGKAVWSSALAAFEPLGSRPMNATTWRAKTKNLILPNNFKNRISSPTSNDILPSLGFNH
jgi:ABC-type iron transport system FetAB ATPase subunit